MTDPMNLIEGILARFPRLWRLYVRLNFCKAELADGTPKADGLPFRIFSKVVHLECSCCAAVRGLAAGFALGVVTCLILL